ncbi:hypothetical protein [Candidatus Marithrix sp. Canyon 246]|nr:hypothetical protein [Candidatus Marithrix sp. Canyon 246]
MKKLLCAAGLLITSNAYTDENANIDFSKAYVIPYESGVNTLSLGGVTTLWDNLFYDVQFKLLDNYNLAIVGALKKASPKEQLEQKLRNTIWKGKYLINDQVHLTALQLNIVQNGYVGGRILHSDAAKASEYDHYLEAVVTGDILSQYKIDGKFVDIDYISQEVLDKLPSNTATRYLIRIKRVRALGFKNDANDNGSWSTNREYRMILEGDQLKGVVGIPNDVYGSSDGTSENGEITLSLSQSCFNVRRRASPEERLFDVAFSK